MSLEMIIETVHNFDLIVEFQYNDMLLHLVHDRGVIKVIEPISGMEVRPTFSMKEYLALTYYDEIKFYLKNTLIPLGILGPIDDLNEILLHKYLAYRP